MIVGISNVHKLKSHVLLLENSVGVGNSGFRTKQAFGMEHNPFRTNLLSPETCPYYQLETLLVTPIVLLLLILKLSVVDFVVVVVVVVVVVATAAVV